MAYLTVTTHLDVVAPGDGQLSLREAIAQANATAAADTIRFVATLAGETLVLTGGELTITNDLTIDGGSGGRVTIDADGDSRVLRVQGSGTEVSLRNLGVTGGYGDYDGGAGIRLGAGSGLSLSGCDVSGNIHGYYGGYGNGGGILATANNRVTIADTTMANNRGAIGGAVWMGDGGQLTITGSLIHDNLGAGYQFWIWWRRAYSRLHRRHQRHHHLRQHLSFRRRHRCRPQRRAPDQQHPRGQRGGLPPRVQQRRRHRRVWRQPDHPELDDHRQSGARKRLQRGRRDRRLRRQLGRGQ